MTLSAKKCENYIFFAIKIYATLNYKKVSLQPSSNSQEDKSQDGLQDETQDTQSQQSPAKDNKPSKK